MAQVVELVVLLAVLEVQESVVMAEIGQEVHQLQELLIQVRVAGVVTVLVELMLMLEVQAGQVEL
jgi:hypothetical protein